ncbi:MAG: hypothetical protein EKK61_06195 [Rickettsiales bacterium]|nr:MAG: hypothetical protein EKK61_06195 [Rickettsiales bacterium]
MLLEKTPISIVLIICLITIYTLFNIKEGVIAIKGEIAEVDNQLRHEIDTIHLLKAELAYLSSPERLKELNEQYIKLSDTQISQMNVDPLNNLNTTHKERVIAVRHKNVKWRYKKGPPQYMTVSGRK